jgi:hypothetical protein
MVKITYDENNKKEVQIVEDYFWYKQYVESLIFDWGEKLSEMQKLKYDERGEIKEIVLNHLNKSELKRAIEIHKGAYTVNTNIQMNANYFLDDLLEIGSTKILKYQLIRKFGEK